MEKRRPLGGTESEDNPLKKILALLLLLSMLLCLVACGSGSAPGAVQLPEGMQIAEEGDGYTFYVPEDWTGERATGITMAYVSPTDPSNLTLVRTVTDKTPAAYFAESEAELGVTLEEYKMLERNDNASFGGKSAIYRNYTGKVAGVEYKFLQYLCSYDGVLYLLTYTAKTEIPSGEVSYYDRYLEKVFAAVSAFSFGGKAADAPTVEDTEPEKNGQGMILASDPAVSRYSLWVPTDWRIDLQNGTTSAYTDGAVVTVSYEIPEESTLLEYWEARSKTYSQLYADYTVLDEECSPPAEKLEDVEVWLDKHQAVRYVFTYTHGGVEYKTQKLMTIEGMYIYTVTYTALSDSYTAHLAEFNAIADAFTFD